MIRLSGSNMIYSTGKTTASLILFMYLRVKSMVREIPVSRKIIFIPMAAGASL